MDFAALGADIEFVRLEAGKTCEIAGLAVTPMLQRHAGDSYGYRFAADGKTVVYSTDSEHALVDLEETRRFVDFFHDADLVIFDAMYSLADAISVKADWGHSSNIVGVELCQMAGARELCLFHHEPVHDDCGDCSRAHRGAALRGDLAQGPPAQGDGRLRRNGNRVVNAAAGARSPHRRITAIGVALLAVLAALVGTSERWNAWLQGAWFDTYQIVRPRTVVSQPVTVVEIDERSLARLGQWPWPRTLLADLIGAVLRYKPAAVGVDILMPEPDRLSPERLLARERAARSGARAAPRDAAVERRRARARDHG